MKRGGVEELIEQLARNLRRESQRGAAVPPSVTLPELGSVPLRDLRTVLLEEGVDPLKLGVGSGDTQRVVVGPRVPSNYRIASALPPGVAAVVVCGQLTKAEMNACSRGLAARVRVPGR